jgi:xanthine/uracil permease
VAFIALILASLVLAGILAVQDNRTAWLAAGALAAAVIVGYAVSRTTGMPGAMDDVGNWLEPLGLASLFVEGAVVVSAFPPLRQP